MSITRTDTGWILRIAKTVRRTDAYMSGHFPGLILYPAVFLLETVRQAVGRAVQTAPDGWWEIATIRRLRLRRPMHEAHLLDLEVVLTPEGEGETALTAAVTVRHSAEPVAELSLRLEPGAT
jgi:3-hydroxymyristoyl/3-hydroxydecanoyl-(acyl carrier protein) dehydratase